MPSVSAYESPAGPQDDLCSASGGGLASGQAEECAAPWASAIERVGGKLIVRFEPRGPQPENIDIAIDIENASITISGGHGGRARGKAEPSVGAEPASALTIALPTDAHPADVRVRTHDEILEVTFPLLKRDAEGQTAATGSARNERPRSHRGTAGAPRSPT